MRLTPVLLAGLLAGATPIAVGATKPPLSQDPAQEPSPIEQVEALEAEFEGAVSAFLERYNAAESAEEKQKLVAEYPDLAGYCDRFWAIVEKHPKHAAAARAMAWILENDRTGERQDAIIQRLLSDHIESEALRGVCSLLERKITDVQGTLERIRDESPHASVKGQACYSLAKHLLFKAEYAEELQGMDEDPMERWSAQFGEDGVAALMDCDPKALREEAERCLELVVEKYGDVEHQYRGTLGALAGAELFEIRHLQIGMAAPDIEGEDVDGVKFKLSDYNGKVTVIDFWGDW